MFDHTIDRRSALRRLSAILGGVVTAPLASGLLAGCRTPAGSDLADYAFQTLSAPQQQTLAALVDQILPATDTPGASDVGVPQFIDTMLSDWYSADERDAFLASLDAVDARAEGSFGDLDADAQARLVAAMDARAFAPADAAPEVPDEDVIDAAQEGTYQAQQEAENEVAGMQGDLGQAQDADADDVPFYRQLKELTLAGYYTSEPGATQELQWQAAPGRWDPDVPVSEVGRAWA